MLQDISTVFFVVGSVFAGLALLGIGARVVFMIRKSRSLKTALNYVFSVRTQSGMTLSKSFELTELPAVGGVYFHMGFPQGPHKIVEVDMNNMILTVENNVNWAPMVLQSGSEQEQKSDK